MCMWRSSGAHGPGGHTIVPVDLGRSHTRTVSCRLAIKGNLAHGTSQQEVCRPNAMRARDACLLSLLASIPGVYGLCGVGTACRPAVATVAHRRILAPPRAEAAEAGTQKVLTCSRCKATFQIDASAFTFNQQVRCSNCQHEWFQTVSRLQDMPSDMQLVDYPQEMTDRLAAGKSAEPIGRYRCFVGNLPYQATEDELRALFGRYGTIASVVIMTDETGRPKGFGFVNFESAVAGATAVEELDGAEFLGRAISVSEGKQQRDGGRGRGRGDGRGRGRGDGRGRGGGRGRGSY